MDFSGIGFGLILFGWFWERFFETHLIDVVDVLVVVHGCSSVSGDAFLMIVIRGTPRSWMFLGDFISGCFIDLSSSCFICFIDNYCIVQLKNLLNFFLHNSCHD